MTQQPDDSRFRPCNGSAIRAHRHARGWTQRELAEISGYSVRLIQKAESGGCLSPASMEVLAKTFSTETRKVTIDQLTVTPVSIVQEFVAALNLYQHELAIKASHLFHDDIQTWCAGNPNEMPFAGLWTGIEGVNEFAVRFFSMLTPDEGGCLRNMQYSSTGQQVVAWGEAHACVQGMPTPPMWVWHRYEITSGKISRYENHFDTEVGSRHLAEARARGLLRGSCENSDSA